MKLWQKLTALFLTLLTATCLAAGTDAVEGIFTELTKEGSAYSVNTALYEEFFPGTKVEASLDGNGFTVTPEMSGVVVPVYRS